jgi:hypothetical protein
MLNVVMPNVVVPLEPFVSYEEKSFANTAPGLAQQLNKDIFLKLEMAKMGNSRSLVILLPAGEPRTAA